MKHCWLTNSVLGMLPSPELFFRSVLVERRKNMHRRGRWHLLLLFTLVVLASTAFVGWGSHPAVEFSISGGMFSLERWTLSAGGGIGHGGDFTVAGSAGLVDADQTLSGGVFSVRGGFWGSPRGSTSPMVSPLKLPYVLHNARPGGNGGTVQR